MEILFYPNFQETVSIQQVAGDFVWVGLFNSRLIIIIGSDGWNL